MLPAPHAPVPSRRRRAAVAAVAATVSLTTLLAACGDGEPLTTGAAASAAAPTTTTAPHSTSSTSSTRPPATTTTNPPTTNPPSTTTTASGTGTGAGAVDLAHAQRLLLAQGYGTGDIDGQMGPATAAALTAYQQANALVPTGTLDAATWQHLRGAAAAVEAQLPASVVVDLSDQHLTVYNAAGAEVSRWPISTGAPGDETPAGSFAVQSRQRVGTAKDAETTHMDFFTVFNGNIGFHGIPWVGTRDQRLPTPLGIEGVSHGCIRMEDVNAEYLYTFLPDGAPVTVQP